MDMKAIDGVPNNHVFIHWELLGNSSYQTTHRIETNATRGLKKKYRGREERRLYLFVVALTMSEALEKDTVFSTEFGNF